MSFTRKKFFEGITYHEADWDELQNNIATYYDPLLATIQGNIADILADYLTSAHKTEIDPHPDITIDYVKQGTSYKKLSAAEYAEFLTGFYDILDSTTTVKFGHNRDISGFYFARGADADGADIYANDLFSRGYPVYVLVFASPWILVPANSNTVSYEHSLGYRPSFGMLHISFSDPTGEPEDYIYTDGFRGVGGAPHLNNYAAFNNVYYQIHNNGPEARYFKVFFFAYLGA